MFNWLRGNKEEENKDNQEHLGSIINDINTLHKHVVISMQQVAEITTGLSAEYSLEALSMIAQRFEKIGTEYTDFTLVERHTFYEVIHRSKSRLDAAKKVAQQANKIAQLFEKYTRKPKSYSKTNSRFQINKLSGELKNLAAYCTPDIGND